MEAFRSVKLCIGFLHTPTNESPPAQIPRGLYYFDLPNSQQAKSTPRSEDTIYFPLLHFPLEKLYVNRWIDYQMAC